jgi:hypothetical protein
MVNLEVPEPFANGDFYQIFRALIFVLVIF